MNDQISKLNVTPLESTGERMIPESADYQTFWEHIFRYRFARSFAQNKRVLDIACGEGYGTASLVKSGASQVIGVDISREACEHAMAKYGIKAIVGNAEQIPLPDKSVDLVVSFETIEHVANPRVFLAECNRVLDDLGMLVISTPNKAVYHDGSEPNPFHCSEMTEAEFDVALREYFAQILFYQQNPRRSSLFSPGIFSAQKTPWLKIPGFRKFRNLLRRFLIPNPFMRVHNKQMASAVDLICQKNTRGPDFTNPYLVRPINRAYGIEPLYFVAVASKTRGQFSR